MNYEDVDSTSSPMPGSPPDLSGSKSSKSSSFHSSYQSDDNTIFSDVGNFEEIGLDDDARSEAEIGDFAVKISRNPYEANWKSDLRVATRQQRRIPAASTNINRVQRELTFTKTQPAIPTLRIQIQSTVSDGLLPTHNGSSMARRGFTSTSSNSLLTMKRNRSTSPNVPRYDLSATSFKVRRSSWQPNRERKTAKQLELECDEDDGDDIPNDFYLENIPISPRPPSERNKSLPSSVSTSPERLPKVEKVRSVGNGTAPKPAEQGVLRSPRSTMNRGTSMGQFPINHSNLKGRAKSWTAALSELSPEAQALTEALEAHAEDEEVTGQKRGFANKRSLSDKPRIRSAIAELPPLRRTDIMIDPLPISKEKEAVLSRTRPSWLPPKNPTEEKRHLREYQKMMAAALESERRKDAETKAQSTCRDDTASSLLRIWEEHVLPNWDNATSQKRTRELWWRGISPRSRGTVWEKAIGNELGLSDASYTAALRRAQAVEKTIKSGSQLSSEEQKKKGWLDRITIDVEETYTELRIFQLDGPLHNSLQDVLKAYAMYRSDVGYIPGTSTIAALLLLNLPTPSTSFSALSNILNRSLPLSFHTNDIGATQRAHSLVLSNLKLKSPPLHAHLTSSDLNFKPETYLGAFFTSLGTANLNLDNATRLWDIMVFEGDAVLVRAAVAWLVEMEGKLLSAGTRGDILAVVGKGMDGSDGGEEGWVRALRNAGKL